MYATGGELMYNFFRFESYHRKKCFLAIMMLTILFQAYAVHLYRESPFITRLLFRKIEVLN